MRLDGIALEWRSKLAGRTSSTHRYHGQLRMTKESRQLYFTVPAQRMRYECFYSSAPSDAPCIQQGMPKDFPGKVHHVTLLQDKGLSRPALYISLRTCLQIRRRVRLELLRWHEDKFARFRDRLATSDADGILERVKAVTQILNGIGVGA